MPRAPSTSCAHRPMATNIRKSSPRKSMRCSPGAPAPSDQEAQVNRTRGAAACPGSGVAQPLDEAQGAVAEAAGLVEGVGFGALRAAGQLDAGGAGGAGAALGLAQQLAAQAAALGLGPDHQGGDPAGGGVQWEVVS